MTKIPRVEVVDQRSGATVHPELLAAWSEMGAAVAEALEERGLVRKALPAVIEASLVDDETIARVHLEFMDVPGPTDVITFPYGDLGEILISVETAARQAREYERETSQEVSLYLIHGILHLAGYDDQEDEEAVEMARLQEELLTQYGKGMDSIHTGPNLRDSVD